MNQDLNILHLITQASFVVQLVMAILMLVSLASLRLAGKAACMTSPRVQQ